MWDWLPSHLWGSGLHDELEATIKHPGWLVGGGSCQAMAEGVLGPPVVAGPCWIC